MLKESGSHNFEVSPSIETRWKQFLEDSFVKYKQDMTYFVLWYLNKGDNYRRLKRKNEIREQVVEDIIQNLYVTLLNEKNETQQKFLELGSEQQKKWMISQVKWATGNYFNYPVGGPHGRGDEYYHKRDTYINPTTTLKSLTTLERRNIEATENSEESWPYAKPSVNLAAKEANPYVLEEIRQQEEALAHNLKKSLRNLSPKERKVIRMRFGLRPWKNEYTLEQIGDSLDLSPERIRQIEAKALRNLHAPSSAHMLSQFMKEYGVERTYAEPKQEEKERPTHYFRWYIYDDIGSKTGKFFDSAEKAIGRARSELTDTFGHPEFKDRTMNALVQEVDEIKDEDGKSTKKFRNIWEANADDVEGRVYNSIWIED